MTRLEINSNKVYEWTGNKIKCPDEKLEKTNYSFYKGLKVDDVPYTNGEGVIIKANDKTYCALIHYFYEINFPIKNRYRVACELFCKPPEISELIEPGCIDVDLDPDYELIKKDTLVLSHFNVTAIAKRFLLVYGLREESPLDLLEEGRDITTDPIYICRFLLIYTRDKKYALWNAVDHKYQDKSVVLVSDDNDSDENGTPISKKHTPISKKYKDFSVRTTIEEDSKIVLKIKREKQSTDDTLASLNTHLKELILNSPPDKNKMNPVVLLDRVPSPSSPQKIRKSSRISARRLSTQPELEQVTREIKKTRPSRTARKSYAEFYDSKIIEEHNATPRKRRTTSSSSTATSKLETTPKKLQKTQTQTPKTTTTTATLRLKNMTPSIQERGSPIVFGNTPMSRARLGLSAHNVPVKMPCRESEYLSIYNFVSVRIKDHTSGCMYISGVPGTGKTMTVCKVMSDMSEQKEDYGEFVFLKLNALALTEPRQIYVEIIKKLLNKKLHWEEALKEMNRFFKAKKKKIPHVILIDELDKLCNRKQDVVYNLLDLPFNSVTPLIVITIANTMDLPERILSNKVNSRLGLVRQTFRPYQYKDLVKIVTERLAADAVFKNEALELVARKVAAVSGDARRALTMCSRATEIAEEENKDLITMDIVDRVVKEMSSSSKVQAIQCCPKLEQYILSSIASEVTRTGNEEVPFQNMLYNLEKLSVLECMKLPAIDCILKCCHNLGSFRLLITQHGRTDLHMTLMLNISPDDIHYALHNTNAN